MQTVVQDQQHIALDRFLKLSSLVQSGGEAKYLIVQEQVQVNGVVETRRKRKLRPGDIVELGERRIVVELPE